MHSTRKTVTVLQHVIDGHWQVEAIFEETAPILAHYLARHKLSRYRLVPWTLYTDTDQFLTESKLHVAQSIQRLNDPEYAEYLRLKEKFTS